MGNKNNYYVVIFTSFRGFERKKGWTLLGISKYNFNFAYRFETTPYGMSLNRYHVTRNHNY